MLSAVTGKDCKRGVLYLPTKHSSTVPSGLQTKHEFLFLLLKLTFLCGYHTTELLNSTAMDSATNKLSFCIFVFHGIRTGSWICPGFVCHFLDRDTGTGATQGALTCSETICLGHPDIPVCGCRDLYSRGIWPNSCFFTWKSTFRWKKRSCLGKLGHKAA